MWWVILLPRHYRWSRYLLSPHSFFSVCCSLIFNFHTQLCTFLFFYLSPLPLSLSISLCLYLSLSSLLITPHQCLHAECRHQGHTVTQDTQNLQTHTRAHTDERECKANSTYTANACECCAAARRCQCLGDSFRQSGYQSVVLQPPKICNICNNWAVTF